MDTRLSVIGSASVLIFAVLGQTGCSSDSGDGGVAGAAGSDAGAGGEGGAGGATPSTSGGSAGSGGTGADGGRDSGLDGGCPDDCDDEAACTSDECIEGKCVHTLHAGHCLIGGECVADGEFDSTDGCQVCDVANPTQWSSALECGEEGECSAASGAAICACKAGYINDGISCVDARYGTGGDGDLTVGDETHTLDGPRTFMTVDAQAGDDSIAVDDDAGFDPGDQVLVHNLQGVDAGRWEVAEVEETDADVVSLRRGLQHSYPASDQVAVLRIPSYQDVTIEEHGVLQAPIWDGLTGGVLAFKVRGTFTLAGQVDMRGRGYRGGAGIKNECLPVSWGTDGEGIRGPGEIMDPLPNHGGGGGGTVAGCLGTSGGGGGHVTPGSDGACGTLDPQMGCFPPGMGGDTYASYEVDGRLFFGGGGGGAGKRDANGGQGAPGGGIVLIWAQDLVVSNGLIICGGGRGGNAGNGDSTDSGGGGGAGGAVLVFTPGSPTSDFIEILGGEGGDGLADGAKGGTGGDGMFDIVTTIPL
jgi:hypothetical protein